MTKPNVDGGEGKYLVFNRREWERQGWFTEELLDNADDEGFIGEKYGVKCYLARPLPAYSSNK